MDDASSATSTRRSSKKDKKEKKEKKEREKKEKKEREATENNSSSGSGKKLGRTDSIKKFLKKQAIDLKDAVSDTVEFVKPGSTRRDGEDEEVEATPEQTRQRQESIRAARSPSDDGACLADVNAFRAAPMRTSTTREEDSSSSHDTECDPVDQTPKTSDLLRFSRREVCSKPILNRDQVDYEIKIILCGPSGVGKTSLRGRLCDGTFSKNYQQTIGVEFSTYVYQTYTDSKTIKAMIWDTAGQERFKAVTPQFYRGCVGVVAVYDVSDSSSYEKVAGEKGYIYDAQTYSGTSDALKQPLIMMIGNKLDKHRRKVKVEDASSFCRGQNYMYFECSARTNVNVERAFQELIECIYMERLAPQRAQPKELSAPRSGTGSQLRRLTSVPLVVSTAAAADPAARRQSVIGVPLPPYQTPAAPPAVLQHRSQETPAATVDKKEEPPSSTSTIKLQAPSSGNTKTTATPASGGCRC